MNSREKILSTIRDITSSFPKSTDDDWKNKSRNSLDVQESHHDFLDSFLCTVEKTGGKAIQFGTFQHWIDWFLEYVHQNNPAKIFVALGQYTSEFKDVFENLRDERNQSLIIQTPEQNNSDNDIRLREFISEADLSITSACAGLADSGSVMITSQAGESRSASLLPPTHICLLKQDAIYKNMESVLPKLSEVMISLNPSSIVFIGGPSRTADIEKVLVTGVHGPKNFIVCIIP